MFDSNYSFLCWQREIDDLRHNLASISSTSDDGAQKLKQDYLQKLNVLEAQVIIRSFAFSFNAKQVIINL